MQKSVAGCKKCLSDCNMITYLSTVTSAQFRCPGQISIWSFSKSISFSKCDSRNLNLSPFCKMNLTSLAMWQPSILETYGNITTSYVDQLNGPLRSKYPNSMEKRELISSLTQVCIKLLFENLIIYSKGGPPIQCFWKWHCYSKHIFWRVYSVWWVI